MANFASIGESLVSFDVEKVIFSFFNDKAVQSSIIRTIRKRLFKKGLEKDGKSITTDKGNPYARLTRRLKNRGVTFSEGKLVNTGVRPTNRVTLYSEGHLYASMVAEVKRNQIELVATFDDKKYFYDKKQEGKGIFYNFQNSYSNRKEFEAAVMSLTDKEIETIIHSLIEEIIEQFKREI